MLLVELFISLNNMTKVDFYIVIKDKPSKEKDLKHNLLKLFDSFLKKAKIEDGEIIRKLASIRAKIDIEL